MRTVPDPNVVVTSSSRSSGHSLREIDREGLLKVFDSQGMPRVPSAAVMSRVLRGV